MNRLLIYSFGKMSTYFLSPQRIEKIGVLQFQKSEKSRLLVHSLDEQIEFVQIQVAQIHQFGLLQLF